MRKALLCLTVAGLALSGAHSASASSPTMQPSAGGLSLRVFVHPQCDGQDSFFPISEAYPATSGVFDPTDRPGNLCLEVQRNNRWCGAEVPSGTPNTTAVPGALSLCSQNVSSSDFRQRIDINKFATCPAGFSMPFVQSYRLTKSIPQSQKCPGSYARADYTQFGASIRTWWTLIYTSPGTTFTLDLTVRCVGTPGGPHAFETGLHIDRWVWKVVVTFESLKRVIDVLHSNSIGTSEIPCIASEDMYIALRFSVLRISYRLRQKLGGLITESGRLINAQNELFNMEALIIACCVFADCLDASNTRQGGNVFSSFPPGNDIQMSPGGMMTGIIDTPENPCCCKLLVDLERIGEAYGIISL